VKILAGIVLVFGVLLAQAAPVCVDGTCYPSEEAALADGVPAAKIKAAGTKSARVAVGYMKPPQMLAFLRSEPQERDLADHALWVILLIVLAGGLAANLTPCVLPLVPVNLALVGKGAVRGLAYGLGITAAYGCLGLAAAFGGLAFGTIQSSPWFSLLAACVFAFLGLAVAEVFTIDFSRFRPRSKHVGARQDDSRASLLKPFALGAWSAVLAGACVEPILIATLVLTAEWFAAGRVWAVALPFVLGAGMGLPWPFAAAGMAVLPRPGAWMRWVNRIFAVMMFSMSVWYGWLAWNGWRSSGTGDVAASEQVQEGTFEATPQTWAQVFKSAQATGRPIFVDIWATWCKNCLAMEKTTFADPEVRRALSAYAVVRLQAEDMEALSELDGLGGLGIRGIPAFAIFGEVRRTVTGEKTEK